MLRRAVLLGMLLAGCGPGLPEPESPAAQAYARRCGECHRAYAPQSMTWPMWDYQLGRMRLLFMRLGRPWLSTDEEQLVTDYIRRNAGGH